MKNNTIHLFKLFGIPIGLDISWFLVFGLFTLALAIGYFPDEFKGWTGLQYWSIAAITSILFFMCVLLHELAHSVMAVKYKLEVKSISMYIFGGVSEITSEPSSAAAEFVISLAGPLSSLALAALFYGVQVISKSVAPVYAIAKYLALVNGILAVFNLIPGFPLDGGRVFRAILWGITRNLRRATEIASDLGHAIAFAFILIGVWRLFQGDWTNGLWIAFIGWFLETAVIEQVQQQHTHDLLAGHTVEQVMSRGCVMVPADITVQELVERYILEQGQRCMVPMDGDQMAGLVTLHNIRQVPRERWGSTPARQVMVPREQVKLTRPEVGLAEALDEMGKDGVNQLPVVKDGRVEGMLRRDDIIHYMKTLQVLKK